MKQAWCPKLWTLQSATRYLRNDEKYYIYFIDNLLLFPTVKEFSKSVNSWGSYRKKFDSTFFIETQCTLCGVFLPYYDTCKSTYVKWRVYGVNVQPVCITVEEIHASLSEDSQLISIIIIITDCFSSKSPWRQQLCRWLHRRDWSGLLKITW